MTLSRKDFLTQGLFSLGKMLLPPVPDTRGEQSRFVRPPGFLPERLGECGDCDLCLKVCPEEVITRRPEMTGPVMDFSLGGCSFCSLCVTACPSGVLTLPVEGEQSPLGVARLKTDCLSGGGCFTCSERCPREAIQITWGSGVRVDEELCIGCGNCEGCCPVQPAAIRVEAIAKTINHAASGRTP